MTLSLSTKLSGVFGGGSFGYAFAYDPAIADSPIGTRPYYVAHVVMNSAATIIDPATAEGQASALTALQAIAGAAAAGSTATNQAAGNTLLTQIVALLQQTAAETLWTDNTGAYFIRVDNPTGGAPTWKDISGNASAGPGTGAKPAADRTAPTTDKTAYQAIAAATGIAAGDFIDHFVTTDSVTGAIVGQFWLNSTQGAVLAAAPATSDLTALSLLPQGAATLAQQQAQAALLQQLVTALGTTTDPAVSTGNGSMLAQLKGILSALLGTLKVSMPTPATVITPQVVIATTGVPVPLPANALVNNVVIKARSTNAPQAPHATPPYSATVGGAGVTTVDDGSGNGYPLAPGEAVSLVVSNTADIWVNGTAGDVFFFAGN